LLITTIGTFISLCLVAMLWIVASFDQRPGSVPCN